MAAITFPSPSTDTAAMWMSSNMWRTSLEDWASHRTRIRQLYLDEDKTLKDVMAIMEREHGFKAT
jgi:hypothetical protein